MLRLRIRRGRAAWRGPVAVCGEGEAAEPAPRGDADPPPAREPRRVRPLAHARCDGGEGPALRLGLEPPRTVRREDLPARRSVHAAVPEDRAHAEPDPALRTGPRHLLRPLPLLRCRGAARP